MEVVPNRMDMAITPWQDIANGKITTRLDEEHGGPGQGKDQAPAYIGGLEVIGEHVLA